MCQSYRQACLWRGCSRKLSTPWARWSSSYIRASRNASLGSSSQPPCCRASHPASSPSSSSGLWLARPTCWSCWSTCSSAEIRSGPSIFKVIICLFVFLLLQPFNAATLTPPKNRQEKLLFFYTGLGFASIFQEAEVTLVQTKQTSSTKKKALSFHSILDLFCCLVVVYKCCLLQMKTWNKYIFVHEFTSAHWLPWHPHPFTLRSIISDMLSSTIAQQKRFKIFPSVSKSTNMNVLKPLL